MRKQHPSDENPCLQQLIQTLSSSLSIFHSPEKKLSDRRSDERATGQDWLLVRMLTVFFNITSSYICKTRYEWCCKKKKKKERKNLSSSAQLLKIQNVSAKQNIVVIDKQTMQGIGLLNTDFYQAYICVCVCVCVCVSITYTHTHTVTGLPKQSHPCPALLSLVLVFSSNTV